MANLPTDKIISCFYGSSEDCVKVVNTGGTLMSFNPNGLSVMEIDNEADVLGKDWVSFWEGNMQSKAKAALDSAKSGKLAKFEGYCPTFKGNMKYWEVSVVPLNDEFGDVQWILVTSKDVTKYKDLEKLAVEQQSKIDELEKKLTAQV